MGWASVAVLAALIGATPHASAASNDAPTWIGVAITTDGDGVRVGQVFPDSPAQAAGIQPGDSILRVDGVAISGHLGLIDQIAKRVPGDAVKLGVSRDGKPLEVVVTLAAPPEADLMQIHPRGFAKRMMRRGFGAPQVRLGVRVQTLSDGLREYFRAPTDRGVLVSDVTPDSPAAAAGLRAGDILLAIDDAAVASAGDVRRAIGERKPGDGVAVRILRDGAESTLTATVEAPPDRVDGKCECQGNCGIDWQPMQFSGHLEALEDLPRMLHESLGNLRFEIGDDPFVGGDVDSDVVDVQFAPRRLERPIRPGRPIRGEPMAIPESPQIF